MLRCRATVIVPTFEYPETDSVALRIYEEIMPGYNIVAVRYYIEATSNTGKLVRKPHKAQQRTARCRKCLKPG